MSVVAILEMPLRPDVPGVDDILRSDLTATAAFAGNQGTEVLADPADPSKLWLLTHWADQASLDTYVAWRGSPEGATRLAEIASGPPTSRHYVTHMTF
jgi:quinol monooxygenase YgiN